MPKPAKPSQKPWDGSIYGLQSVGHGATALVFAVDDFRVVKVPIPSPFGLQAIAQEREIYRCLGKESNRIVSCPEPDHPSGILLERCTGSVRDRLQQIRQGDGSIPRESLVQVGRWAHQAAQGLAYIHQHNVIQADVGCHNMLLDRRDNLKLADFSGSCIEGSDCRALVIYDLRCRLSNVDEPDRASDLFALGCAIYEMATGHLPYHDLPSKQVQRNFFRKEFPSLDELKRDAPYIAEAIDRCWHVRRPRGFKSAEEVVEVLANEIRYTEKKTKVRHECQTEEQGSGHRNSAAKPSKSSHHKKRSRSVTTSKSSRSSQSRTHDRKRKRHRDRSLDKTIDQHRSKAEYRNSEGKTSTETAKPSLLYKFFNSMRLRN